MAKDKNEIIKVKNTNPSEAELLISRAIDKNVPVETMEKLLAMRRELKAEKSRELFYEALSNLQNEMPIVTKNKIVKNKDGTERYRYAPIDSIISQTKQAIKDNGFSYMIETSTDNAQLNVVCKVTHEAGHTESSSFVVPIDKSAFMNAQQQFAAASTYAKRYAFCNAFGILTGDEDDDANSASETKTPVKNYPPQANKVTANSTVKVEDGQVVEDGFNFTNVLKQVNNTDNLDRLTEIFKTVKAVVPQTVNTAKMIEIITKKGTILRKNAPKQTPVADESIPH